MFINDRCYQLTNAIVELTMYIVINDEQNSVKYLISVRRFRAVVARVTDAVVVGVLLIGVWRLGAVVALVQNAVVVHVRIAQVAEAVAVSVFLFNVLRNFCQDKEYHKL